MAYEVLVTPIALMSTSSSGSAAPIDLDILTMVRLRLVATVVTGTLTITGETSVDQLDWRPVEGFEQRTATGSQRITLTDLERYLRLSWVVTGGAATFLVDGKALLVYGTTAELAEIQALETFTDKDNNPLPLATIANQIVKAGDEADDVIGDIFKLPLKKWPTSHTDHVLRTARYKLQTNRGYDDEAAPNVRDPLRDGYKDALAYWKMVGTSGGGAGFVDQTPDEDEGGAYIVTTRRRGWAGR